MLGSVDAALLAWTACLGEGDFGYTLPLHRMPALMSRIAACMPGDRSCSARKAVIEELFEIKVLGRTRLPPRFLELLKEHNGQVHFLYFWRAFSEALHLVAAAGVALELGDEGFLAEFETLRDIVLALFESCVACPDGDDNTTVTRYSLVGALHDAAARSAVPDFWRTAAVSINGKEGQKVFRMQDITVVMLSWLHDAVAWPSGPLVDLDPPVVLPPSSVRAHREPLSEMQAPEQAPKSHTKLQMRDAAPRSPQKTDLPVLLHVYDVSLDYGIQKMNGLLANMDSPLKLGGAFHAGVEVNSLEWCFGHSSSENKSGIGCVVPRSNPQHHFRQTVLLGHTTLSPEEIAEVVSELIEEYPGTDYNILRRNCCHFADDFCQRLGVGQIPGWVHRLARVGTLGASMVQSAQNIHGRIDGLRKAARGFLTMCHTDNIVM